MKTKKVLYLGNLDSPHCKKLAIFYSNYEEYEIHSLSLFEVKDKLKSVVYHSIVMNSERRTLKNLLILFFSKLIKVLPPRVYYPCYNNFLKKVRFYERIDEINPDLLHAHFATNAGFIAYRYGKVDYVVSCWGSDVLILPEKSVYTKNLLGEILKKAKKIQTSAVQLNERIESYFSFIESNKLIDIQYGLERDIVSKLWENRKLKLDINTPTIINTRRANKVYNNETFINAARIFQDKKIAARFILITGGIYFRKYEKLIMKLKLKNFTLIPFLPQEKLYRYLQQADIYISTALSDGLSLCLLEAFAGGLFPIVTNIRANRNVIDDCKNGVLFAPGDVNDLVDKIQEVLTYDEKKIHYAINRNYKYILDKQIQEKNLKLLEGLYK